ncbi:MAG: hypothetical protein KAJ58_02220 [Candidatus Pacebacteria bacterium]|nr:hypothetical protein [Candidatus Paceibacterota bacterium]
MSQEIEVVKVSYNTWLQSAGKWSLILRRVKLRECFVDKNGFSDMQVNIACGYCIQPGLVVKCQNCFLFRKTIKIPGCFKEIHVCYKQEHLLKADEVSHFWLFMKEMRKDFPDFEMAEHHCQVILDTINEDCPDEAKTV